QALATAGDRGGNRGTEGACRTCRLARKVTATGASGAIRNSRGSRSRRGSGTRGRRGETPAPPREGPELGRDDGAACLANGSALPTNVANRLASRQRARVRVVVRPESVRGPRPASGQCGLSSGAAPCASLHRLIRRSREDADAFGFSAVTAVHPHR